MVHLLSGEIPLVVRSDSIFDDDRHVWVHHRGWFTDIDRHFQMDSNGVTCKEGHQYLLYAQRIKELQDFKKHQNDK